MPFSINALSILPLLLTWNKMQSIEPSLQSTGATSPELAVPKKMSLRSDTKDFSFYNIKDLERLPEIDRHVVREEKKKLMEQYYDEDVKSADNVTVVNLKFQSNQISNISRLDRMLKSIKIYAQNIKVLDLSNNNISSFDGVMKYFPNLLFLHFHMNQIKKLNEIASLNMLTNLINLTLCGNPVSGNKHYKNYALHCLPNLKNFDFTGISKQDREGCETWERTFRNKLKCLEKTTQIPKARKSNDVLRPGK